MQNILQPRRRALAFFAATLLTVTLLPARAAAWGDEGHRIVARIAEKNLSSAARARVAEILAESNTCGGGSSALDRMLCAATWADTARNTTHKNTYNWHFVDISLKFPDYDAARDCEPSNQQQKGKCGIFGLDYARRILRGEATDPKISRAQALMFVIHIVGDLHQPLHTVLELVGGNGFKVSYFGIATDLHKVWDTKIVESEMLLAHKDEAGYAQTLEAEIDHAGLSLFQQGEPVAWLNVTHARAINDAYGTLPKGSKSKKGKSNVPSLDKTYFNHNLPVVNTQLERGGARLAVILNEDLH